jgi:hypothetical protein
MPPAVEMRCSRENHDRASDLTDFDVGPRGAPAHEDARSETRLRRGYQRGEPNKSDLGTPCLKGNARQIGFVDLLPESQRRTSRICPPLPR